MRRIVPAFLLVLILGGVIGYTVHAQQGASNNGVPEIITYRGYLEDSASGTAQPVTGNKSMTFKIFSAASGGSALWTCGPMTVPLLGGHFEVPLGGGSCPFTAVAGEKLFNRDTLYLEIVVEGTTLTSRQRITSAPYAVAASQSDNFRVNGTLVADGATTLSGGLTVSGTSSHTSGISVSGGTASLNNGLAVTGSTSLAATTIGGALTVNSTATLNNGLTVTGSSSLGAVTVNGNLNVTGSITNFVVSSVYSATTSTTTPTTTNMVSATDSICYLYYVRYNAAGSTGYCSIDPVSGVWQLKASQSVASGFTLCQARCLSW